MNSDHQVSQALEALREASQSMAELQRAFQSYQSAAFPERSPQFFALELAGEAGEVANNEKKIWKGSEVPPELRADEAADVLISVMNYANSAGIDLAEAVRKKLLVIEERRTRPRV